jgi:hypothetical protein
VKSVEAGATFVHTGSWSSFHGGEDDKTAALDLTSLTKILPVEVKPENDVYAVEHLSRIGALTRPPQHPVVPDKIEATSVAPDWMKAVDFSNLTVDRHRLNPRPEAQVLLSLNGRPLLVTARYGKGKAIAYLGFSPAGNPKPKDSLPILLDRVLPVSAEHLLFVKVAASILALAAEEEPVASLDDILNNKTRSTPLFEQLKGLSKPEWPEVAWSWTKVDGSTLVGRARIHNGGAYLRRLRLRLDGPDFENGDVLPLWSNQYFDLLPNETAECEVEIRKKDQRNLKSTRILAELLQRSDAKSYPVPAVSASFAEKP